MCFACGLWMKQNGRAKTSYSCWWNYCRASKALSVFCSKFLSSCDFLLFCSDIATVRGVEESPHLLCLCCRLLWLGQGNGFQPFQLDGIGLQRSFPSPGQMFQPLNCNMRNRDCVLHLSKNKAYWGHSDLLLKVKAPAKIARCNWFDVHDEPMCLPIGSLIWTLQRCPKGVAVHILKHCKSFTGYKGVPTVAVTR